METHVHKLVALEPIFPVSRARTDWIEKKKISYPPAGQKALDPEGISVGVD